MVVLSTRTNNAATTTDATTTPSSTTTTTTTTTTPPSALSRSRSLLSRLTSPLRSRARNLTNFHIRPDEPHRQYSPGDIVKGAVVITIVKPVRITHLTVCLHGFVRVYKQPSIEPPAIAEPAFTVSSNPMKTQYFGNGHASLFQDEIILCGEKRLDPGIYEFNFELDFPSKGLPTSIDFERGTISYMLTATITRPTTLAPTSTCDRKLAFVETVDIGPIKCPQPRTISLDPIARRPKRKPRPKAVLTSSTEPTNGSATASSPSHKSSSPAPDDSASQRGSVEDITNPQSPIPPDVQSTFGAESTGSSSTGLSSRLNSYQSARPKNSQADSSMVSLSDKTITATIELLKPGGFPGDNIPIRISIKHTKPIKSLHGIIITLYRQGRIDSAPPLSLFVDLKGKAAQRLKHEEYYPKSKTGLSGLSLTSAGSSSIFRKDLAQTFAPILVDPKTLTAVVNASVRIPEDCFPTISGVPGEMISFKYHVEVLVDLGGKLAGQQRHVPRVGAMTLGPDSSHSAFNRDGSSNMLRAWGGNVVATDHLRREKSVVQCLFGVTIGTTDSTRGRGRGQSQSTAAAPIPDEISPAPAPILPYEPIFEEPLATGEDYQNRSEYAPYRDSDPQNHEPYHGYCYNESYNYHHHYLPYPSDYSAPSHAIIPYPPPEPLQDENLSEKEQLRRAEQRLLPSRPPLDNIAESSNTAIQPSAIPSVPASDHRDHALPLERSHAGPAQINGPSAGESSTTTPPYAAPSAPTLADINGDANPAASNEDKQELERRRLLVEVSAPSDFPADIDGGEDIGGGDAQLADADADVVVNRGGVAERELQPSAPVLTEEDEDRGLYSFHGMPPGMIDSGSGSVAVDQRELLPRYER